MNDMYKDAVCQSMRVALARFIMLQETTSDRTAIRLAGKKVEDFCAILDELERQEQAKVA